MNMSSGVHGMIRSLGVSRESLAKIELYVDLLLRWQKQINLIGPTTVSSVWERHVLDSLQLLPLLPPGTSQIAELGSGAGIPGLLVGIATAAHLHLYESNIKKCAFLREAARLTGVKATIHTERIETIQGRADLPIVDCVLARALAPLPTLLEYSRPFLGKGAIGLFHKGQDVEMELTEATKCWKIDAIQHRSVCDPNSVILEIREARHV